MVDTFQGKPLEWWYINLAKRTDRRDHAKSQFAQQGIKANRFEAFSPSDWKSDPQKVRRIMERTPGAVGCYMSQMAVIRSCPRNSIIAVCEDDICFAPDMATRLSHAEQELPDDWDVFYLGATFHVPGEWYKNKECSSWSHKGVDAEPTDDKHIMRVYGMWGTYAYFVNGTSVEKVANMLDENCHNSYGIDHNFIQLGDRINAYCFVPGMAWQYDNESNIGKGITYFSGFKKQLGPYVWTDDIADFKPEEYNWKTGEYNGNSK